MNIRHSTTPGSDWSGRSKASHSVAYRTTVSIRRTPGRSETCCVPSFRPGASVSTRAKFAISDLSSARGILGADYATVSCPLSAERIYLQRDPAGPPAWERAPPARVSNGAVPVSAREPSPCGPSALHNGITCCPGCLEDSPPSKTSSSCRADPPSGAATLPVRADADQMMRRRRRGDACETVRLFPSLQQDQDGARLGDACDSRRKTSTAGSPPAIPGAPSYDTAARASAGRLPRCRPPRPPARPTVIPAMRSAGRTTIRIRPTRSTSSWRRLRSGRAGPIWFAEWTMRAVGRDRGAARPAPIVPEAGYSRPGTKRSRGKLTV